MTEYGVSARQPADCPYNSKELPPVVPLFYPPTGTPKERKTVIQRERRTRPPGTNHRPPKGSPRTPGQVTGPGGLFPDRRADPSTLFLRGLGGGWFREWINEIPTVPIYYLAKPQPRERAWQNQRGKKTLLSLTLVWGGGVRGEPLGGR